MVNTLTLTRRTFAGMRIIAMLIAFFVSYSFNANAQNLVQNPSFETNTALPSTVAQYALATNWSNANSSTASPDYLHMNGSGIVQLPNSIFGTVTPYQGNAVMGLAMWYSNSFNFREYVSQNLATPLTVGSSYTFSFYITNGIPGNYGGTGTPDVSVHFSATPINQTGNAPINVTPTYTVGSMVYSNTWTQISFTFTATAPYAYFAIGNFKNDANTTYQQFDPSPNPACYYFLDDVSLVLNTTTSSVDVTGDTLICLGDSATMQASNSTTYAWADSLNPTIILDTDSLFVASPTTTTTYFVYGDSDTASHTVYVNYPANINLGNDTTLCEGSILTLDATSTNATYLWQDNSTNATFDVSLPGIYWVETMLNNCPATDSITVNYNPIPIVDLGNDTTLCQGEQLTLDATTSGATYLWSDNSTNATLDVTQSGTYWVEVTVNNCTTTDSIDVTYVPLPTVNLGNDTTVCYGQVVPLDATTPNATYLWQNNATASTFNVTQQGTYWVEVSTGNCTSADSIVVNFAPAPIVDLGNDTSLCQGSMLTLDASAAVGAYVWQDNSTNSTFDVTQSGTYWVDVTANGCTTTDSIDVTINSFPIVNLGNDTTVCDGQVVTLNATTTNGTYLWSDNSTNSTLNVTQQGIYWVELTVNNCTSTDSITINVNPIPSVDLGNDTTLCLGQSITLDATTPNATYLWQNNATNPSANVSQPGLYWVEVTANNCTTVDQINVNVVDVSVVANATDASCFGLCNGTAQAIPSGGDAPYTYVWNQGVTGDQTGNATGVCAGTYTVDVLDANGCSASANYTVNEPADIAPGLSPDATSGCYPLHVNFTNTSASTDIVTTQVDFGDGTVHSFNGLSAFQHTYDAPGVYTVTITVTTVNGCQYSEVYSNLIAVHDYPNADFTVNPNNVSMLDPVVNLYNESSSDVVSWYWVMNDAQPNQTATSEDVLNVSFPSGLAGEYDVTLYVTNAFGCADSVTHSVTVNDDLILYVPNAFTPDGDEFNQNWEYYVEGIDIFDFNLKVFNRWGEIIWESNDASVSWDGTYNGQIVQDGTYTWTIEFGDLQNDKRYTFNGHVTVIR